MQYSCEASIKRGFTPPLCVRLNTTLSSMTLGFMNGQQEALPLADSDSQSGTIICNRGGSG